MGFLDAQTARETRKTAETTGQMLEAMQRTNELLERLIDEVRALRGASAT